MNMHRIRLIKDGGSGGGDYLETYEETISDEVVDQIHHGTGFRVLDDEWDEMGWNRIIRQVELVE